MLLAALLAAATPPACTLESAQPTTVREVATAPDTWVGRCVRLEGFTTGSTFYQDVGGTYRFKASDKEDRPNDGWLGLYFLQKGAYRRKPLEASVAGVVDTCSRQWDELQAQAGPNDLVMLTGYCHYHLGLILLDVTVRHGTSISVPRLTGEASRRRFGDLLTVEEAGSPPAEPLGLLRRFVAAVRAGDAIAAASLADGYNDNILKDPKSRALWGKFLVSDGPFAFLRKAPGREPVFLRERQSRKDDGRGTQPDWFACFCTTPDCAKSWPIAAKDAAAEADPAYACVRLYRDFTEGKPWQVGIDLAKTRRFNDRD